MSKRRITLSLDADVVEAMQSVARGSLSAFANDALRSELERKAHQAALLDWLEELNRKHGEPSDQDYPEADAVLDELMYGGTKESGAV
jgi:predicted transcriptional regulator